MFGYGGYGYGGLGFRNYPYQNLQDLNLDYVLDVTRKAVETLKELDGYADRIVELEDALEKLEGGDLTPELASAIVELVQKNIIGLVGEMVKFVFFGLTDDGYFVAYIPEPWDSIIFNTTEYDIWIDNFSEYGHLTISY